MSERKVKVRIAERRAVVIDGRLREAGEVVAVAPADAKALVAEGYAERVTRKS